VILPDVNLLLYVHNRSAQQHDAAVRWLRAVLAGPEPLALTWTAILGFLRMSTNPKVYPNPMTVGEAIAAVNELLTHPAVALVHMGERHWDILTRLIVSGSVSGPAITDAHLAALAIEHGATLCTTDRDFARFLGLRWQNPLQA
jgi:toxin-antitoxin system PIN domain toxin